MRSYKDELKQGLDNLKIDIELKNNYLAKEFFENKSTNKYKSMQGVIYCNFYLNEYLTNRPLSELKEFKNALSVYNHNHEISKSSSISIDYLVVCDTVELQRLIRSNYPCDTTIYDALKSYENNKTMLKNIYKDVSASDVGASLIALYEQIMEEYREKLSDINISFDRLEKVMKSVFGASWVEDLSSYIGCDSSTVYKWKSQGRVPSAVVFDAQTLIKKKIQELQMLENYLLG